MRAHSEETVSAVDGPGNRVVFWTTGCGFRRFYCHSPDTWNLQHGRRVGVDDLLGVHTALDTNGLPGSRLAQPGRPAWFRTVLVPGVTDAPARGESVARYVAGLPSVARAKVPPFHQLGR